MDFSKENNEKIAFIEAFKIGHRVAEGSRQNTNFELDKKLSAEALAHYLGWKKDDPKSYYEGKGQGG